MSISPLESWLSIHLLPRVAAGGPGTVAPAQLYECPPSQVGEQAEQGVEGGLGCTLDAVQKCTEDSPAEDESSQ
ncbi:aurora kinase a-interacting, partial [Lynx pardinus]